MDKRSEVDDMVKPDPYCQNYDYEEDGLIVEDEWTLTARAPFR